MNHTIGSRTIPALGVLVSGLLVFSFSSGCGKPPTIVGNRSGDSNTVKEGSWKAAARQIRKDPSFDSCRLALGRLMSDLPNDPTAARPRGLSPDEEEALTRLVPLSKEDRDELRSANFTAHDAAYLAECLYLRDAVRSFDVPGDKPQESAARRADAAFAWVCRQVYLQPWLIPVLDTPEAQQATALPPTEVLRRGYGSGLERMYVLLGLLQQMGLDACLIGPDKAETLPAGYVAMDADGKVFTDAPRGPFWAVGVRVGKDVRLYDPWRSEAFPMPLSELKKNPESHKAWFENKANVSGITPKLAKEATICLAVPVNSLAPRMVTAEEQWKADLGVHLATNATRLHDAFPGSKFWNPPNDPFAYGRTARLYLPSDMGGVAPPKMGDGLFRLNLFSQLPPLALFFPRELLERADVSEDARNRIGGLALDTFGNAFLYRPTPRERLQRGQFQDAASELVNRQDQFSRGLERRRNNPDAEKLIKEWAQIAAQLYAARGQALADGNQVAFAEVKKRMDEHWTKHSGVLFLVDRAVSEVGLAEASFLLAVCKHEQAERLQTQLDAATGDTTRLRQLSAHAWADARHAWDSYSQYTTPHSVFTGRVEHARTLTARAQKMAKKE